MRMTSVGYLRNDFNIFYSCRIITGWFGYQRSNFKKQKREMIKVVSTILLKLEKKTGNSKSLWVSVKIAKDLNVETIPKKMFQSRIYE